MQLGQEQLLGFVGLGVAGHREPPTVHGGDLHVDHLHGLELFEHATGRQSGSALFASLPEGHVQTVGQERDEDVGLDALLKPVMDGPEV